MSSSSAPDGPFAPSSSISTAVPPGRTPHASDPRSLLAGRYALQPLMSGLVAMSPAASAAASPPSVKHAASSSNLHASPGPRSHSPSISAAAGVTPSVSRPGGASTTAASGLLSPIPMHPGSAIGAASAQRGSLSASPGSAIIVAHPAPPLSTASPLVLQRALGFDKRSEHSLVSLITALAAVPLPVAAGATTASAKVPDPKPFSMLATQAAMTLSPKEAAVASASSPTPAAANDEEETTTIPPTAPPEAADLELRAQVAAVRRSAGAGHDATEVAASLHGKHPSIAGSPLDALTFASGAGAGSGAAELLRHTKGLVEALSVVPSSIDARWRSPFVSPPAKMHISSTGVLPPPENPGVAAIRAQYTSFDQHGEWRPVVTRSDSAAPGAYGSGGGGGGSGGGMMITSSSSIEPLPPIVPSISLAVLDLNSNRARSHAFRLAIRAALLTSRTEKSYHACVTLLSGLTPSVAGNDNHAKLYPFLKLWNRASLLERKLARKSELKKQLDNLHKHMYYTPGAFGDQKVPHHRAAYHAWLKTSATKIHEAMLKIAGEIEAIQRKNRELLALKPLVGLVSKAFCACFGPSKKQLAARADLQHAPRGHGEDDDEEDNAVIEEEERRAGAVALKSGDSFTYKSAHGRGRSNSNGQQRARDGSSTEAGNGAQPDRVPRKFGKRPAASALAKMQRHTNRAQRKNRNAARAARRAAQDGSVVEADEPESPASGDSGDENWERTPAEEAERARYLAAQAVLRRAHANHEEDRRRVRDTAAIMKDLGLDEETEEDSLSFKRSLGKVGARVRNHRNPREGLGEVEDVHTVYAILLWSLLRLEPDCARIAHTSVKSAAADSGNASPRMLSPSSSIVGSPSGALTVLGGPEAPVNTHVLNPDFVSAPVHQVAAVDHTRGSVVSPPAGSGQGNGLTQNPLHSHSHASGGGGKEAHARLTAPVQTVHSRTPQLSPLFNPISSKASRDFLDSFATLYDVGLVFRGITMLHVLAVNQQRTEAYWRTCSATMVALEQLRAAAAAGGTAWTLHEQACYVLGLERLLEWSARCTANFARLFALPTVGQAPPMINRMSTVDPAAEEQKQSDGSAQAPAVPETPSLQKRASIGTQGSNGAQLDWALNTHQEAFRACVQVMSRSWNTLQALATAAAAAAAAAATRSVDTLATAVVSNALAAPAPVAPTFSLVKYLSPLLSDALSRLYEDLSWHAKRGAATTAELAPKPTRSTRPNSSSGATVRETPLRGDEHLTLLLHSLIAEIVSLDSLGRTVVAGACPMIPPELLGDLARQTLIARFWADAHRYIGVERVPKLVAARRELALASATGSPSSVESSAARQLGKEITAVFELYSALAWFQYSVQPPLLDPYTGHSDRLSVQPQTARAWLGLRGWFAPIVDGFLDTLLEGVDHDVGGVAASGSAPSTSLHSLSLKAIMQKMDAHLALLLYKPATRRHKRIMIDSLAAILVAYIEARLLTSSAPPVFDPSTGALKPDAVANRRSGLVEELQARYFLNRLYTARYPTLDSTLDGSKPDSKAQAAALKTAGSSTDLALIALGPSGKPEHHFGFDPSIPRLTLQSIRNLNELRVANIKMDQLLRLGVGGGRPSLRRGTRARQVQNLFVQSCAALASELCAVLLPATISNLLRQSPQGSGISNRWSLARVEKCFAELLGFLFEHVEAIKTARAHVEVVREIGLYLLLETTDLLAAELRNVARVSHEGVVFYKAREENRLLTRDQILRVEMAIKVVKTFVIEVCAVPAYWFESSIPLQAWSGLEGPLRDGSQLAQRLGLGPYAPKNLGVSAPPVVVTPPQPKYVLPPAYSSTYMVLTEVWKAERLLAVVMAPSATIIALYNSLGATDESIAPAVQMAPAHGEESDEEEMAAPPPVHARSGNESDAESNDDSDDEEEQKHNGHLSPPNFNGATPHHRSAQPSNAGLSIDVSTPSGAVLRQQGSAMSLPQFPAPRSGSFSQSPAGSSGDHTLPPAPHVFQVLGYTRWDAHRLLVHRSKFQDDSAAHDFLAAQAAAQGVSSVDKVKPPGMPRDALAAHEPQGGSAGLLGKIGSWFGSNKDTPKEAKKEKEKDKKADKAAASAVPTRTGTPQAGVKLFGGPLSEAVSRAAASGSSSGVPRVIEDCLRFLRSSPAFLQEPGLFRVGGNQEAIEVLRSKYDERYDRWLREGGVGAEPKPTKLKDLHDVTGLFKLYYRSLPEPLIPFEFYARFIKCGQNKNAETRVPQMKELVQTLPPLNQQNLQVLCAFLNEVAAQSAVNKMTAENLAIVFTPNLLRPKVETAATMMTDLPSATSVIATLIAEHSKIFG